MKTDLSRNHAAILDATTINLDRLQALAELLAGEECATQFATLERSSQVALFGLVEDMLADVRAALTELDIPSSVTVPGQPS